MKYIVIFIEKILKAIPPFLKEWQVIPSALFTSIVALFLYYKQKQWRAKQEHYQRLKEKVISPIKDEILSHYLPIIKKKKKNVVAVTIARRSTEKHVY